MRRVSDSSLTTIKDKNSCATATHQFRRSSFRRVVITIQKDFRVDLVRVTGVFQEEQGVSVVAATAETLRPFRGTSGTQGSRGPA